MDTLHIVWLALVQGLTEFLPVSSSAHLILVPRLLGWPDQGLAFDVAVHLGTLIAVVGYFRRDVATLYAAWCDSVALLAGRLGGRASQTAGGPPGSPMDGWSASLAERLTGGSLASVAPEARLAWGVILGTLPAALVGLTFQDVIEVYLRSPLVIATTTILFGLLLWYADRRARLQRDELSLGWGDFLIIGCAQALALVPGTSRSGITITAGLLLGLTREAAARYSFLLSMPIIVLSGLGVTKDLLESTAPVDWAALGLGTVLAGVSAFACIHLFLAFINRMGMTPFVIYRLALGALLFIVFV